MDKLLILRFKLSINSQTSHIAKASEGKQALKLFLRDLVREAGPGTLQSQHYFLDNDLVGRHSQNNQVIGEICERQVSE